jgi:hypothetical protein
MLKSKLLFILPLLMIIGCATEPQVIEKPVQFTKPPLNLAEPAPVSQIPFDWKIVTQPDNVYFGLTTDGYHALALDMAQLRTFIEKQTDIINAMKQYYETPEKPSK